ncbi:unnamed protein product [Leptidea sinapis]|uniref:RNA helicase n=1 Tax=Leptidea sinapis TaxID=189913 RepID=A0A5E4QV51_9NEOP|nr:unnamed protein product [Leptidea sinapis]
MSYNSGGSSGKGLGFAGFTMPKRNPSNISLHAVPPPTAMNAVPPPNSGLSKQGYSTMNAITQNAVTGFTLGKKRAKTEDEYFDDDDEPPTPALAYIPAPGSPTYNMMNSRNEEEEEDPLDAYMAGLEQQAAKDLKTSKENEASGKEDSGRGTRGDIDEMDDEESYYKYMEDNPLTAADDGSDVEIEYDEDGNPLPPPKKKFIDPLPPIDHSEIEYEPFEKNFYTPHEEIEKLTHVQVEELKKNLGVKITGPEPPKPVSSFAHLCFDEQLMKAIRRSEYTQPTPVQAAGIPAALSGRDIIGIARTGSGKTAAFIWPLLIHIMDQKEISPGDGPIGLILAPTRELAQQIYMETKRFGKVYNIRCVCCYGGGSKWEQTKALEGGAEIIVGTPGRVIDLIKCKATNLKRVTYLVLDEADRMFDMGFGQTDKRCCSLRRFRAAWRSWPVMPCTTPCECSTGPRVRRASWIFNKPEEKWSWLLQNLVEFLSAGSVLIFVTKKLEAEQTAANLGVQQYDALLLHGDMDQADRNQTLTRTRTASAARAAPACPETRTLSSPGTRTRIPEDLMHLAMQSSWFRKSRFKKSKGKNLNVGGCGLGSDQVYLT